MLTEFDTALLIPIGVLLVVIAVLKIENALTARNERRNRRDAGGPSGEDGP
ncbi:MULTISPECIES: hypothetical protein [unclassified Nonomuraea]|uniref:hypothetical protein n=1 Tax=unclassified Nonomuraea TaxID=2593643 RepID=UPI0033D2D38A